MSIIKQVIDKAHALIRCIISYINSFQEHRNNRIFSYFALFSTAAGLFLFTGLSSLPSLLTFSAGVGVLWELLSLALMAIDIIRGVVTAVARTTSTGIEIAFAIVDSRVESVENNAVNILNNLVSTADTRLESIDNLVRDLIRDARKETQGVLAIVAPYPAAALGAYSTYLLATCFTRNNYAVGLSSIGGAIYPLNAIYNRYNDDSLHAVIQSQGGKLWRTIKGTDLYKNVKYIQEHYKEPSEEGMTYAVNTSGVFLAALMVSLSVESDDGYDYTILTFSSLLALALCAWCALEQASFGRSIDGIFFSNHNRRFHSSNGNARIVELHEVPGGPAPGQEGSL